MNFWTSQIRMAKKTTTSAPKAKAKSAKEKTTAPKKKAPAKKAAVAPKKSTTAKAKPVKIVKDENRILAEAVIKGILEKKGQNIVWLDLSKIENSVCDYFILCEGNSTTQVDAIADSVEFIVKKETKTRAYRSEGWENALWILIDYVTVVVHVFDRETRQFYNLESLWADADVVEFDEKELS
jgi:ribosome-associated protein